MKSILVIQLHRFGDLIQTTPLFPGLKEKFSGCYLAVLAQKDFAEVLMGNPYINGLFLFDKVGIIKELQNKDISLKESYDKICAFFAKLREHNFDLVINLSSDEFSALAAYLVNVKDTKGVSYAGDGFRYFKHKWMIYLFTVISNRIYNSVNMVDFHLGVGELPFGRQPLFIPIDDEAKAFSKRFFAENGVTENDFVIGLQLGASRDYKTWPAKHFARLGDELIKHEGAKIVLFGHPLEAKLGEEVCSLMATKPINAIGKTSIKQLASMLRRCRYLVSNDTLTAHVAAGVGTRVIGIFLSTCYVHDTAPYGKGHLLLQSSLPCQPCFEATLCKDLKCRDLISPEMVLAALKMDRLLDQDMRLAHVSAQYSALLDTFKGVDLYRTHFDSDGMLECVPLTKRPLTERDILRHCFRSFWKGYLRVPRRASANVDDLWDEMEQHYTIEPSDIDLKKNIQPFIRLSALCNSGIMLLNKDIDTASFSKRISAIDRKITSEIDGCATFLTHLYTIENANLAEDITRLTRRDLLELFMKTQRNALMMKGLLSDIKKRLAFRRRRLRTP